MNSDRGPIDDELLAVVAQRRAPVLLVGAWGLRTILAAAGLSPEVSVIALTETDAARIRRRAAAEKLPVRVYLPSAALDPLVDRDPETGSVRWTAALLGPVPALRRVAVVAFSDESLAVALGAGIRPDTAVVVAGSPAEPVVDSAMAHPTLDPVLDALQAMAESAVRARGTRA